jgi:hypothetical protein
MKFEWPQWLDPRRLNSENLKSAFTGARTWLIANRTLVLASSLSLLVGLWGGAVLGRVSLGGSGPLSMLGVSSGAESARSAGAPRAGLPEIDGMAFVRLRTEMGGTEPRASRGFSKARYTHAEVK